MPERIVSLAPSATAILEALDVGDRIVGSTSGGPGANLGGWLTPDPDEIEALEPDLVLTTDDLQTDLVADMRDRGVRTAHFDPRTLADVPPYVHGVGAKVDREARAHALTDDMQRRIKSVREDVADRARPVVYCEEWSEPPMVAGNWVPDVVEAAGGRYPFCTAGERSRPIEANEVREAQPEYAILHICGRGRDVEPTLLDRRGWNIPQTIVVHDDLLNQPSLQLADAIEHIASLLHPEAVGTGG